MISKMVIKSLSQPYRKRLECNCDTLTYRSKTSRKRGIYKVYEGGFYKEKDNYIRTHFWFVCMSCGLDRKFNLEVKNKWKKIKS